MQTVSIGPLGFSFAHILLVLSFGVALLVGALYGRSQPLGIAMLSGLMTWGALSLMVNLIEVEAREIPDSGLSTLDGESVTLVDLQPGKPKVVNIWASWCPPCIREMPVLESAQGRNPGITFVFVNQGEQIETINSFLGQQDLSLRNVLSNVSGSLAGATGSHALTTTLFYDAEGRQVDVHMGELSNARLAQKLEAFEHN